MSSLEKDLLFSIHQFLHEKNFKRTVHTLEQESGIFFSMPYFQDRVTNGDWDEVENYLSGFTKLKDNTNSTNIFTVIQHHKNLEAQDREDEKVSRELINARGYMFAYVKKLIEANPVFRDKLKLPIFNPSTLRLSLNLQNHLAAVPTSQSTSAITSLLQGAVPKPAEFPTPFRAQGPLPTSPLGCVTNAPSAPQPSASYPSSVPHPSASACPIGFNTQNNSDVLKHPTTPKNKPAVDIQNDHSELLLKGTKRLEMSNEFMLSTPAISTIDDVNASSGSNIEDRVSPVAPTVSMNENRQNLKDGKPTIAGESSVKSRSRELIDANEPSKCRILRLPDSLVAMRVSRLMYTNSGSAILALYVNAVHKLWKWPENDSNSMGKARARLVPQLWQPRSGTMMTNETSGMNPEYAFHCFALSNNDQYLMSVSGGEISFFNMGTFKTIKTIMSPPPAATFLALHPRDNNIIAIGSDDSSIQIYDATFNEVKTKLKAHQERITGLAFSNILNVLVSSGADSQLCVWSTDTWEKQTNEYLQSPAGRSGASLADTRVQFHHDQTCLLAVQETQIVIYEVPALKRHMKWVLPLQASGSITYATYSCDSKSIYVSFECGRISVLSASSLDLRCRINPSLYLPTNPSLRAYPLVVAAHPSKPNQFAVGLTDCGVYLLEPLESEGKWYP
ncbi:topless-related protein 4-like isoform X2 [Olea europaea var. sylvestris]|uniref:Topless-related 4-like n=1 Tax=Olea europaea subsp. europaea TaxID=158383 RepID=A0A8S0TLA4_OLEEU|nr:topless-related protein 4-like isoform X2 [Olea europaea var. sylvestris]CAA3006575.1 topless-related 4-like [Olea europaea subsp. europaea]